MLGFNKKTQDASFLSTPSARRATNVVQLIISRLWISIHALCEEGDVMATVAPSFVILFLSTPSARRATWSCRMQHTPITFLSTPSARRATPEEPKKEEAAEYFYPRPLRGGRHPSCHNLS